MPTDAWHPPTTRAIVPSLKTARMCLSMTGPTLPPKEPVDAPSSNTPERGKLQSTGGHQGVIRGPRESVGTGRQDGPILGISITRAISIREDARSAHRGDRGAVGGGDVLGMVKQTYSPIRRNSSLWWTISAPGPLGQRIQPTFSD
jgi:hypothetical protein